MSTISASDRRLALTVRSTGALWHPTELPGGLSFTFWDQLLREDKARRGLIYYEAEGRLNPWASATAVSRRRIRFDPGYLQRPAMQRVHGQTHEHRHTLEYRYHAFWRLRYVADDVFRWANECQGVCAELWCMKAQDARKENMIARASRLVPKLATPWLQGGYGCHRIRNLEAETMDVFMEVIDA